MKKDKNPIKIACIGDSVTHGTMIICRKKYSYPSQLKQMLGNNYNVKNYGVHGYTMLKNSKKSYWKRKELFQSIKFKPHIILIMLGTNDSKSIHWKGMKKYIRDYIDMIRYYQSKLPNVKIYIMTPATAYKVGRKTKVNYCINNEIIDTITNSLKKLARKYKLELIDINKVTKNHLACYKFDGVHPNANGANLIAKEVCKKIKNLPLVKN